MSKTQKKAKIVWKSVVGFSKYEVSNTGSVRNCYTEKIRKLQVNNGYLTVSLSAGEEKKHYLVHRLVAIAFIPNPNNLPVVDHVDNDRKNNNVENLRWCTYAENTQFFVDHYRVKSKVRARFI